MESVTEPVSFHERYQGQKTDSLTATILEKYSTPGIEAKPRSRESKSVKPET
jgi:hypothetical protein